MRGRVRGYLFLIFICMGSLFALIGLKQFFMHPIDNTLTNSIWFGIQVLPLLALIPGLLGSEVGRKAFFFASLVGMLYFSHGVWSVANPAVRTWGLWETAFALGLIALGSLATRAAAD